MRGNAEFEFRWFSAIEVPRAIKITPRVTLMDNGQIQFARYASQITQHHHATISGPDVPPTKNLASTRPNVGCMKNEPLLMFPRNMLVHNAPQLMLQRYQLFVAMDHNAGNDRVRLVLRNPTFIQENEAHDAISPADLNAKRSRALRAAESALPKV